MTTWNIAGSSANLLISATMPMIRGDGTLEAKHFDPTRPEISAALERMKTVDWRLLPVSSAKNALGRAHAELVNRVSQEGCIAEVSSYDDGAGGPLPVSIIIIFPELVFERTYLLLSKALLSSRSTTYHLSIGFLTFRVPNADVDLPTLSEFLGGRPYFSDEVSVFIDGAGV
jgi:hypothetical protein